MGPAKIITVANLKGGVGKTTTSYALAAAVANRGRCGVVLDLDPGGGTYRSLAGNPKEGQATIADVLYGEVSLADAVLPSPMKTPGDGIIYTVPFDARMATLGGVGQNLLHEAITPILKDVDYVILDTHPSEADLRGPLEVADSIVIPTKLSINDLNVSAQTVFLVRSLPRGLAPLSGLLVGDLNRKLNDEVRGLLRYLKGLRLTLQLSGDSGENEDVIMYYGKAWLAALNGGGKNLTNVADLAVAERVLRAVEGYRAPEAAWALFLSLLRGVPSGAGSA